MSEETNIEWATSTGNPWIGCTKVSPGCKNCYAATLDEQRFSRTLGGGTKDRPVSHWGPGAPRFRTKGFWQSVVRWNKNNRVQCIECGSWYPHVEWVSLHPNKAYCSFCEDVTWHLVTRSRIFPSLCDWLDEEVPIEWLADFLKLIHDTPNLDWLLLTKRPENFKTQIGRAAIFENDGRGVSGKKMALLNTGWYNGDFFPENVWLGTSVENHECADKRIPELLKIPARVRFLSVEPLLGPVDLKFRSRSFGFPQHITQDGCAVGMPQGIHWVIVGGESGPNARRCNVEWIRKIVNQCKLVSVPCFVKQLGSNAVIGNDTDDECWPGATIPIADDYEPTHQGELAPLEFLHPKGGDPAEWPEDLRIREFP